MAEYPLDRCSFSRYLNFPGVSEEVSKSCRLGKKTTNYQTGKTQPPAWANCTHK